MKFSISFKIIFFLLLFNTYNSNGQDKPKIINPGKSVGSLLLGQTTLIILKDTLKIRDYDITKDKEELTKRKFILYYVILHDSGYEGISFDIYSNKKNPIKEIYVTDKCNAQTVNGIIVGKSNFKDVYDVYGIPDITKKNVVKYILKGIDFISDSTNIIKEIVIYQPIMKRF